MKHYSVYWGPRESGIEREHASVFSLDVLSDGFFWSFDKLKWKDANVGYFMAILNLRSADKVQG